MGCSARSVDKSQHGMRYSAGRNGSVVLPGRILFGMEIHWLSLVDPWQTYVLFLDPNPLLITVRILSGVRQEHPLVSHHSALYASINSHYITAPQSLKPYARPDWHLLPTSILTSRTLISKIVEISSHLFSTNSPLSPVLVVTYSTTFIRNTMKALELPARPR